MLTAKEAENLHRNNLRRKFVKKNKTDKLSRTSSQLDDFFGRPALLKGEDRDNYRELQKAIAESMQPESLLDELEVQEVIENIWEGRRFQNMAAKLIDAERRKAFEHLTSSKFGYLSEEDAAWLESIAGKPYPDEMTETDVLRKIGLSTGVVQAHAVLLAAEYLAVVDQLASNRVSARKTSLKDYARRKRLDAKEKRLAAKAELQHRDLANDNRPAEHRNKPHKKFIS
jgi:hypothetical protein